MNHKILFGGFLSLIGGFLIACLERRIPGSNDYQGILAAFVAIGGLITLWGGHEDSKESKKFTGKVEEHIERIDAENKPNIVAIGAGGKSTKDMFVQIKNIGKKPAKNVRLIFTEESNLKMITNFFESLQEVVPGTPCNFNISKSITTIEEVFKSKNNDIINPDQLLLTKFYEHTACLILRFYFKYEFNSIEMVSDKYSIFIDEINGIISFGKDS